MIKNCYKNDQNHYYGSFLLSLSILSQNHENKCRWEILILNISKTIFSIFFRCDNIS